MTTLTLRKSELDSVEALARTILTKRKHEIVDDRLDGRPWFFAVLQDAKDLHTRQRLESLRAA